MYGYEIVELRTNRRSFNFMDIPIIDTFKIIVNGPHDDLHVNILLEDEDSEEMGAGDKLDQKLKNLKLYLNLFTDHSIDVKIKYGPEFYEDKKSLCRYDQNIFESLNEPNLPKFVDSHSTQQYILLQIALDEIFNGDLFNGFPKLVNWLDDNDHKGASRFCKIRDVCSHGVTDDAILKVEEIFPGEFEFESNVLIRNSQKNIQHLKKYLPEVLEHIKQIFKEKLVKNS